MTIDLSWWPAGEAGYDINIMTDCLVCWLHDFMSKKCFICAHVYIDLISLKYLLAPYKL